MALVRCPSCNKRISNAATSCPGCGEPRPDSGWHKSSLDGLGWLFVVIVLVAMAGRCGTDQPKTTSSTAPTAPSEAVVNSPWDGSVWQVERYLERNLKDPDSFEAIEWGKVVKTTSGYQVRCLYRAKNSLGGYVVENMLVDLDHSGRVTGFMKLQ